MTAHVRRSGLSLAWHGFYLACMLPNLIVGGYDWARGDGFPYISLAATCLIGAIWSFQDTRSKQRAS